MQNPFITTFSKNLEFSYIATEQTELGVMVIHMLQSNFPVKKW